MGCWEFVALLVVAGLCGVVAQAIAGYSRGGCLVSIVIGFVGALLGMWLQRLTGADEFVVVQFGDTRFPVIWSVIGAVLFVAVVGFLTRRPRAGRYSR